MWIYEKRLEYPVAITRPDVRMAKLLMAQYGGPDSDVCAYKEISRKTLDFLLHIARFPCCMQVFDYCFRWNPHAE